MKKQIALIPIAELLSIIVIPIAFAVCSECNSSESSYIPVNDSGDTPDNTQIDNSGSGTFLVFASSDNGVESNNANKQYGYKPNGKPGEDMRFIYLTGKSSFINRFNCC